MRKSIPPSLRTELLLANRHACCICGKSDIQIHHIDFDPTNNQWENLSILCLEHHDRATAPKGFTASLTQQQIKDYKGKWEYECRELSHKIARSKTAFFMVDYKNAERIRQLYAQLDNSELRKAYLLIRNEFIEEDKLRQEQGFDCSIEPNTSWNKYVASLVEEIKTGTPHPIMFENSEMHPLDPYYPIGPVFADPAKAFYDIWCQIMIRCLLICRKTFDIENLMKLDNPLDLDLSGSLIVYEGNLIGKVVAPNEYKETPVTHTVLRCIDSSTSWLTKLSIKTHYVYSETAAESLSKGRSNGVLMLRSIDSVRKTIKSKLVKLSCTPLIMGSGGGKTLKIG